MLLSQKKADTKVTFENINASVENGSANWQAKYVYGNKQRKVTNNVSAQFKFKDGKIIENIDSFNLWKWSQKRLELRYIC